MGMIDRKQSVDAEAAILVGVELPGKEYRGEPLEELAGLVETAGATIVGRAVQKRQAPDPATYIGQGKAEEIEHAAKASDADVVIFDNDLSPAQTRNLEKAFGVKVLDRTEVILDIFSTRAQTHESRLAVELAQLEYSLPRLKRMWTHLSRMKMGVGMRGPGEKQLETDRRLVEKRIRDLKRDLEQVQKRKEREVAGRSDRMTVSLVGYTNAGKSTLMNTLTKAEVLAEDKLFATLDTRTRRWQLPGWGPVLLSDTVGFIRDLPHRLIASFKATLEEARQADLLIHVADASSDAALDQILAVYDVLQEIGIEEKDTVLALNKVDAVGDPLRVEALRSRYPNAVTISAKSSEGLDRLAMTVSDGLSSSFLDLDVEVPVSDGRTLAFLAANGEVLSRTYHDDRVVVHCRLSQKHLGPVRRTEGVSVQPRKGEPASIAAGDGPEGSETTSSGEVA